MSAGVCDTAETCTGASAGCPANAFRPGGATCTDDANVCTDDACDGAGTCLHTNNVIACDDGKFCTATDTCSNGQCRGSTRNCADSVSCTIDACSESTDTCTHIASDAACDDGLFCNGAETCNAQAGCRMGSLVACGDGVGCTEDSCNETTDSCESSPRDARCDDEDPFTVDTCDSQSGCEHLFSFRNICRPAGYYGKRAGDAPGEPNIVQSILDSVGGIEVCGQTITRTSNEESPYLEDLGLDSALEGICVHPNRIEQRKLYRELVTTALNCAMSGSDSCDAVVNPFIDVSFSQCDALCAGQLVGSSEDDPLTLEQHCTQQLACYNSGGRLINGKCAYGNCNLSGKPCGGDFSICTPVVVKLITYLQSCERFTDSCRDGRFCQPALDVCPARRPVTSRDACKEAKRNACTIDSCD